MCAAGAKGETRQEMIDLLGLVVVILLQVVADPDGGLFNGIASEEDRVGEGSGLPEFPVAGDVRGPTYKSFQGWPSVDGTPTNLAIEAMTNCNSL